MEAGGIVACQVACCVVVGSSVVCACGLLVLACAKILARNLRHHGVIAEAGDGGTVVVPRPTVQK